MAVAPPLPVPDPQCSFFWEGTRARELRILRCRDCGTYIHLPRPVCRRCRCFDLAPQRVSGQGTLYSFSITHKAFHPFFVDRVPFALAVVELVEQPALRILTNLVGVPHAGIRFGMRVEVDFEELSPELTIPVFRAAQASAR